MTDSSRDAEVEDAVNAIRKVLSDGSDKDALDRAAEILANLARRTDLFPRSDFAGSQDGSEDVTTRLRQDPDGGFALYVHAGMAGHSFRPHDHGDNWAIIAGIEGREVHRVYERLDDGKDPETAKLKVNQELALTPGSAIALPRGAVHSVHGGSDAPILHLHLYERGFHKQAGRTEYDLENDRAFYIPNLDKLDSDKVDFG